MMTSSNREVYEGKILETLVKNSERLAVVEHKLTEVKSEVKKVDSKLENIDSRLVNVETEVKAVRADLKELDNRVTGQIQELDRKLSSKLNWLFTILVGIGGGILATLYSQPILNALSHLK